MEEAELDERLRRYTAAEARIAGNLVELDDHPTYALLASDTLTGTTQHRLGAAIARAPRMWVLLDSLRRHLELARATREGGRLNTERRTQLVHLLVGSSLLVEIIETPLAERDLLEERSSERRITLDRALDELRDLYTPLRDGIATIDGVWREVLPRLDAADQTLSELALELDRLDGDEPLVAMGLRKVEELRAAVMDDPLSVAATAGRDLDELVRDAAHHVGALRSSHDELVDDLTRTEELVAAARSLRAQAATYHAEALAKVAGPLDLAQPPAASFIDQMAQQAAELRASTGPWQHTRQWLSQWIDRAERLVAQLDRVVARNRAPIDRRDQLRGLLAAYRAKAATVGSIEDGATIELVDEAHSELFTAPADLDRAEQLLAQLAAAIAQRQGVTHR